MALNEKKALLLIGAGTLLACGGLGYLSYLTHDKIEETELAIEAEGRKVSDARKKIAKVRGLEDEVIVLRQNVQEYVKILPDDRMVTEFVRLLSDVAASTGVTPKDYRPIKKSPAGSFVPVAYRLQVTGTFWQILSFINRLESQRRFMIVPEIAVTPGERGPDADFDEVVHAADLLIQTFRYNPKSGTSKPTKIHNEDRRVKELQERIARDRKEIVPPTHYMFTGARNRRDPFIDPRIPIADEANGGLGIQEQKKIFETVRDRIAALQIDHERYEEATKLIERIELYQGISSGIMELEQKIQDIQQESVFTYLPLRSKFLREVKIFEDLRQSFRATGDTPDFSLTLKELKTALGHLRKLLHSGDLDAVIDYHSRVRDRLKATAKDAKRRPWVEEIERLSGKAQVAKDFRSKDLKITGVGIMPTGAVAIINDRAVAEGEHLEDDLVVHHIRRDSVEFIYKDVVIVKKR